MTHRRNQAFAMLFALVVPLQGIAAENVPPEALHVTVLPDRYVAAGKAFADLAALESWSRPILLRTVWLDGCGPEATRQLMAAVERLHAAYPEGVQVRTLGLSARGCANVVAKVDADFYAVDSEGRSWMP